MEADVLASLATAAFAGLVVGIEREASGNHAGMRTHSLVALGAALFTIVGAHGFEGSGRIADPTRIAAQVASGVGFVGAGAIIKDRWSVRGLTTAATLWLSGALGVAAGAGLIAVTLAVSASVIVILVGLRFAREPIRRASGYHGTLRVTYDLGRGTMGPLVSTLTDSGLEIAHVRIDDDDDVRHVELHVSGTRHADVTGSMASIAGLVGMRSAELHPPPHSHR